MRYFAMKHRDRPVRGMRRGRPRRKALSVETLERRELLAAGPLGMNVDLEYVDIMKESNQWLSVSGVAGSNLDASGWPTTDASVGIFDNRVNQPWNGPDPNAVPPDMSGTYHLSFHGKA